MAKESKEVSVNVWGLIKDAPTEVAAASLRKATAKFYVALGQKLGKDPADLFILCAGSTIDAIRELEST